MAELQPPLSASIWPSALKGTGSQTKAPAGFSDLFLVSCLDETKHHFCEGQASSRPSPQVAICSDLGALAAHVADEIGANFPLTLADLRWQQETQWSHPFSVTPKNYIKICGYNSYQNISCTNVLFLSSDAIFFPTSRCPPCIIVLLSQVTCISILLLTSNCCLQLNIDPKHRPLQLFWLIAPFLRLKLGLALPETCWGLGSWDAYFLPPYKKMRPKYPTYERCHLTCHLETATEVPPSSNMSRAHLSIMMVQPLLLSKNTLNQTYQKNWHLNVHQCIIRTN